MISIAKLSAKSGPRGRFAYILEVDPDGEAESSQLNELADLDNDTFKDQLANGGFTEAVILRPNCLISHISACAAASDSKFVSADQMVLLLWCRGRALFCMISQESLACTA